MIDKFRYAWAAASRRKRFLWICLFFLIPLLIYVLVLDIRLQLHFSGARWEIPSRVYARPLELYNGKEMQQRAVMRELRAMGYIPVKNIQRSGQFSRDGNKLRIYTRQFAFSDSVEPSRQVQVYFNFAGAKVTHVEELVDDEPRSLDIIRFEPLFIGAIYPQRQEDRILVNIEDVPPLLTQILLTVEDRDFYQHFGIKPSAIARALLVNIREGRAAQGGSTLTQQLVKNFYLTNEKTLWRKAREAIMSLLLEFHYDKDEILEAYLNEVYLGQDGARAIHGFGMASYFYFSKPLQELKPAEIMLLVGMVKGPSAYDPVRHPVAAKKRWQTVYKLAVEHQHIAHSETQAFPVIVKSKRTRNQFPHYIQLVKRQLARDYDDDDLQTAGLRIFTALDPHVQWSMESVVEKRMARLQSAERPALQSAMILLSRATGEIVALKGGNEQFDEGFNRAMDAHRPVGSLLKPAIFLTALNQPAQYHLATLLDDSEFNLKLDNGDTWSPQNYDEQSHGIIPLYRALADSNNIAAVRLGMNLGLDKVIETLHRLGIERDIPAYPAILLGALELSPLEVATMYQTIANAGYLTPAKAIRYVMNPGGELLNRYPLEIESRISLESNFLLTGLLQQVVRNGTGSAAYRYINQSIDVAGKTGTTDQLRDSWFAGFSQNYTLVSWIGNDVNEPVQLTGSSGALQLWANLIAEVENESLRLDIPAKISTGHIDVQALLEQRPTSCSKAVEIPYIEGYPPSGMLRCQSLPKRLIEGTRNWLQQLF
jgi:penicillin-binding protein 1B